ncbi:MAG: cobalamin B12-binding domain-containing protein [Bacillota bacterium]
MADDLYTDLVQYIIEGDAEVVEAETDSLLKQGQQPMVIINKGLLNGMAAVGELFKEGEMFVPEVMMSAQAVTIALDKLKALVNQEDMPKMATIVIGTVKGDLHDIGKNLVSMMMENSGFTVIDLGTDVAPEDFCQAVADHDADIVGMSALLTTTMPAMQETVEAICAAGYRDKVKIIIGGAPVTAEYAQQIGADGYSEDAVRAVELCKNLLSI